MIIKKAVITAAGYGTRFFPLTKTIQKEMIPILNKPLIDYVVDDCIEAGIEEIIFIVKDSDRQLRHYYSESMEVKEYLERMGKMEKYDKLSILHTKAKFTFVNQTAKDPYGTATPLKLARPYVDEDDAFVMLMGDDFIYNRDGSSETKKMIDYFVQSKGSALASFVKRPKELLVKYGVAEIRNENNYNYLTNIIEKPEPGEEPSDLCNISKYIFTPKIFDDLENQELNPIHKELLITDTLTNLAKKSLVTVYSTTGEYLDGGFVEGWLKANLLVASKDPQLLSSLKEYINSL